MSGTRIKTILLFATLVSCVNAGVTYTYTANNFNYFICGSSGCGNGLSSANHITASFTLGGALPPGLALSDISGQALNWSMNDGNRTLGSSTGNTLYWLSVATDNSGRIVSWFMNGMTPDALYQIQTFNAIYNGSLLRQDYSTQFEHGTAYTNNNPGTWSGGCQVCITSPSDGASPRSQFVALSGTGTAGDTLSVLVGGVSVGQVAVDSEGNWEALPYVSLYGSRV